MRDVGVGWLPVPCQAKPQLEFRVQDISPRARGQPWPTAMYRLPEGMWLWAPVAYGKGLSSTVTAPAAQAATLANRSEAGRAFQHPCDVPAHCPKLLSHMDLDESILCNCRELGIRCTRVRRHALTITSKDMDFI
jgi:hypothetical protein